MAGVVIEGGVVVPRFAVSMVVGRAQRLKGRREYGLVVKVLGSRSFLHVG